MASNDYDDLTKLFTRAAFNGALRYHATRATDDQPASLIMADVDHFKKVNDDHGHPKGDAVLKEVARRLLAVASGKGDAYRYGGEEFTVILPNHAPDEALAIAERARRSLEASKVDGLSITSSYGVATVPVHAATPEDWLMKADKALYDAKNLGRNLVRLAGEPPPQPGQSRQPARKQAVPGTLSPEAKEQLRLAILRHGSALCPIDQVPLTAHRMNTVGSGGQDIMVNCPGCGFNAHLQGPQAR